jgi:hypothetical protein
MSKSRTTPNMGFMRKERPLDVTRVTRRGTRKEGVTRMMRVWRVKKKGVCYEVISFTSRTRNQSYRLLRVRTV